MHSTKPNLRAVSTIAALAALVALPLTACSPADAPAAAGEGGKILIGGSFSLTGAGSVFDVPIADGLRMAVDEVNKDGGIEVDGKKYTFDLKIEDAKSEPSVAVAGARKLVTEDGAKLIFGTGTSNTGVPVAQYLTKQDAAYFATFTQLETLLGQPGYEHVFKQWASTAVLGETYIPAAVDALGIKAGVSAMLPNEDVSKAIIAGDEPTLKAAGAPLVSQQLFQTGATDFAPILDRVKGEAIDGLYIGYSEVDVENIIRQAVTTGGVPLKFITNGGANTPGLNHKDEIDGYAWLYYTRAVESSEDPAVKSWTEAYKKQSGRTKLTAIDSQGLGLYDTFKAMAASMVKAGTVDDVDKISATMHDACFDGVRTICWDENGRAIADYDIGIIKAGELSIENVPVEKPEGSSKLN